MTEKDSTGRLIDYYTLLSTFPSRRNIILSLWGLTVLGGLISFWLTFGLSSASKGLFYGAMVLALSITATDQAIIPLFSENKILTPRRINIISYFWTLLFLPISVISASLANLLGEPQILVKGLLFILYLNFGLRTFIIPVFSEEFDYQKIIAIFLQPMTILIGTIIFFKPNLDLLIRGLFGLLILCGSVVSTLWYIEKRGGDLYDQGLIPLFRAFIYSWTEDFNQPLEEAITKMGEKRDVEVESLVFHSDQGCRAAIVVPYIHPGPFRRLGSSDMPWYISKGYRRQSECEALVMHGLSKHEMDITQKKDLEKVTKEILGAPVSSKSNTCTPLVRTDVNGAQATCQIFGEKALITLTLAPKSHDDLPPQLLDEIRQETSNKGIWALVVDCHNNIDTLDKQTKQDEVNLYLASMKALDEALKLSQREFSVSVSRVVPDEWGLEEGMGPEGIAYLLIKLNSGEKYSYLLMDSNNMISGLSKRLIEHIHNSVDVAVVTTSDTHIVNALGATDRGYNPFGAEMDEEIVMKYVDTIIEKASRDMGECRVEHQRCIVEDVTVLGERGLETLANVLENGFTIFKTATSFLISLGIFLSLILLFL